jgi:hypothetical protein
MSEYLCPHCKNPIYDDEVLRCHFCGESLNRASDGIFGKMKYSWSGKAVAVTLLVLALFFLLLSLRL